LQTWYGAMILAAITLRGLVFLALVVWCVVEIEKRM
jgi:hypothetical protein